MGTALIREGWIKKTMKRREALSLPNIIERYFNRRDFLAGF